MNDHVLKSILIKKLETLFPDSKIRDEVLEIIKTSGNTRMQLAILKLADKNPSIEKIIEFTEYANKDYRDVLAWAEYPRQAKNPIFNDSDKSRKQVKDDLQEYNDWLNS